MPPMMDPIWGDLIKLVFFLGTGIWYSRRVGPNRAGRILFWLGLVLWAVADVADDTGFDVRLLFDGAGAGCIAAAMWLADPDRWLGPNAACRNVRLLRFIGWCVCLLGAVLGIAIVLLLGLSERSPSREDWLAVVMMATLGASMVRLGYRMAHVPLSPPGPAAEPPGT